MSKFYNRDRTIDRKYQHFIDKQESQGAKLLWKGYNTRLDCYIIVSLTEVEEPNVTLAASFIAGTLEIAALELTVNHKLALDAIQSGAFIRHLENMYLGVMQELKDETQEHTNGH